MVSGYQR